MATSPEIKPFFLSKTVIVNAIIAVCALIPAARDWVAANPETTLLVVSGIGVVLRFVSAGRIVLQ